MATLGDLMVRIGADISGLSDALKSVVSQASDAADAVADKLDQVGNVGQRLAILGASLTAAITLPLEEIARKSIDVAGSFEQTQIAFQTLLGSSSLAKSMLTDLYAFASSTPFEIPEVLSGARKLMALGFAAKDVIPILRVVGDQAAAMGQGGVGMDRILMNLGKIEAQGKVTGHELRNLGEDDVPALASIALALGKSKEETAKLVSEGKVDAETGINAILRGMQLRTGDLMKDQMSSFQAQMSNLKDQITLTAAAIGNTLLPVGKILVNWAQEAIAGVKELAQWFAQLPAPIQASAIGLATFAASVGPALVAIGGLLLAVPQLAAGLKTLDVVVSALGFSSGMTAGLKAVTTEIGTTIWMVGSLIAEEGLAAGASFAFEAAMGLLLSPVVLVTGGIALLVAGLAAFSVWVYQHWAGVKAFLAQVFDGLGDIWSATLGVPVNWAIETFTRLVEDTKPIWSGFGSFIAAIWRGIADTVMSIWNGIKTNVIEPMARFLESIPGVKKIETAGAAFTKADHDSSERAEMTDVGHKLRVGNESAPFALHSKYQADLEKHNAKLQEAVELLAKFKKGYEDGIVSEKDFKQAQANVQFIKDEKIVDESKITAKGKPGKVDRNALDALSGQHAHDEAGLTFRKAEIEHDYQMSQPGSGDRVGYSAEQLAQEQIKAAEQRKRELDQIALEELQKTQATIDQKLKLYRGDQAGHQALIEAKQKAEDHFVLTVQKNANELENVQKQAGDRIAAARAKQAEEDLKDQQKQYEMALKTVDLQVQADEKRLQQKLKQFDFDAGMADKRLQFELETGTLSKNQYLRLKQEQYDQAFAMEMAAIQKERDEIEKEFADLRASVHGTDQAATDRRNQIEADYNKRIQPLNERQQGVQNKQAERTQDTEIGLKKNNFDTVFKPMQSSFASGISGLIKGTQTFQQAWVSMSKNILGSWIDSISQMASKWVTHLAQMAVRWVAHKLMELTLHVATNQMKVASDEAAASESNAISLAQHLREIARSASQAAAKAFTAVAGIPVVGPILAPIAAAAAFAGVMAFGAIHAEGGAVLPNHDTFGFLHPNEMVLPSPISQGLQSVIKTGGLGNATSASSLLSGSNLLNTGLLQQIAANTLATAQAMGATPGSGNPQDSTESSYSASFGQKMKQGALNDITNFLGLPNKHLQQENMVQLLRDIADNTSNLKRGIVSRVLGGLGGIIPFFEDGGVVGSTGPAVLHAREMVLPAHISTGLQSLIASGGLAMPDGSSIMSMQQGGGLSSTVAQALRNTAQAASSGDTHNNFHGDLNYHAAPGEKLTEDRLHSMFKSMLRNRNLQMA